MVAAAGVLAIKMVIAAISGMGAATLCHPLDVIRVQMQTDNHSSTTTNIGGSSKNSSFKGPLDCAKAIVQSEKGFAALYAGIGAAYLRQWLYGSCRIGIYAFLLERAQAKNVAQGLDKNAIPFVAKLIMGCTSGGIGSLVGTPSELALVRMSNDSKLPLKDRQNYKGVVDCISRIIKEEGVAALWTGATVTVLRAMVLSACVLGITSETKLMLKKSGFFGDDGQLFHGIPLLFAATMISSLFANIFANPFDVVKSRTQQQKTSKTLSSSPSKSLKVSSRKYTSMMDCFVKIIAQEGVWTLWAGFVPAFIKLAPYTVISLLLTEKITQLVMGTAAL